MPILASEPFAKNLTGEAFLKAKLKEEGVTELKSHGKPSGLLWHHRRGCRLVCLSLWIISIPLSPIVPMINAGGLVTARDGMTIQGHLMFHRKYAQI